MTNTRKGRPAKKNPACRWYLLKLTVRTEPDGGFSHHDVLLVTHGSRAQCVETAKSYATPGVSFILGRNWPPS